MKKICASVDHLYESFDGSIYLTEEQCRENDKKALVKIFDTLHQDKTGVAHIPEWKLRLATGLLDKFEIQLK
jgi:hypothetical protein